MNKKLESIGLLFFKYTYTRDTTPSAVTYYFWHKNNFLNLQLSVGPFVDED